MGYLISHSRRRRVGINRNNKIVMPTIHTKNKKEVASIFPSNAWTGQRCFILGGGDTLRHFNYDLLKNELTIGVNRIFEVFNPTINYAMDAKFINFINGDEKRRKRWNEFKGNKVFLGANSTTYPDDVIVVRRLAERVVSMNLSKGIYGGTNSGFGAVMLAIALGCKEIYLLGYDMKIRENRTHWHSGYPDHLIGRVEKSLGIFIKNFEEFASSIAKLGISVYNLSPDSNLNCFPKKSMMLAIGSKPSRLPTVSNDLSMCSTFGKNGGNFPVVVSFYTKGTSYFAEAQRLVESLKKFHLDYDVVGIIDLKNWQANVRYKPTLIKKMLKKYRPRPVLYVDADAEFARFPSLFNNLDVDIGVCEVDWQSLGRNRMSELLGGTIYMSNTNKALMILDDWIDACERTTLSIWDQKLLAAIIGRNFYNLPPEYCTIFDSMGRNIKEPVIIHNQASRRLKSHRTRSSSIRRKARVR